MNNHMMRPVIVFTTLVLLSACSAKRPVLYPSERVQEVGEIGSQYDIDECMQMAAEAGLESNQAEEIAGQTAVGGGLGAGIGAVAGGGHGEPRARRRSRGSQWCHGRFPEGRLPFS